MKKDTGEESVLELIARLAKKTDREHCVDLVETLWGNEDIVVAQDQFIDLLVLLKAFDHMILSIKSNTQSPCAGDTGLAGHWLPVKEAPLDGATSAIKEICGIMCDLAPELGALAIERRQKLTALPHAQGSHCHGSGCCNSTSMC